MTKDKLISHGRIAENRKARFNYEIRDSLVILKSSNSKLLNDNLKYDGFIQLNPFDLTLNITSETGLLNNSFNETIF